MPYVAIESVTKQDGTYSVSTYKKETREEAESAYHSILTVAAKSTNAIHAATLLNPEGQQMKAEYYKHNPPAPEPEPTPEPEPEESKEGEE